MPLSQLKDTSARWNIFSKVDQLGAIDLWTLTISLDALVPQETAGLTVRHIPVEGAQTVAFAEYECKKKVLTLAAHEYTHFLDATSTLWGLQHLASIAACSTVDMADTEQFHVLKKCHSYMRSIRLPEYYTTVNRKLSAERPWRSAISTGVLFSSEGMVTDRPVIFVNFLTMEERRLVRSPLSLVSLLEASAMAKEIEVRFALLNLLTEAERTVELRQVHEEIFSYLYNPELTEYSACFHLLANLQNEKDIGVTSRGVGVLCRTVLNAPAIAFKTAAKNIKAYADAKNLPMDHVEVERLKKALEQSNRGALFFLIAVLLPKDILLTKELFYKGMEQSLRMVGLSLVKLQRGAYEEAKVIHGALEKSELPSIRTLASCGYENFRTIFPGGMNYRFENLNLPPAIHGDKLMSRYTFSDSEQNQLAKFDLDAAYDELIQCQLRAENFAEACI